jgi:hypothetical protein
MDRTKPVMIASGAVVETAALASAPLKACKPKPMHKAI